MFESCTLSKRFKVICPEHQLWKLKFKSSEVHLQSRHKHFELANFDCANLVSVGNLWLFNSNAHLRLQHVWGCIWTVKFSVASCNFKQTKNLSTRSKYTYNSNFKPFLYVTKDSDSFNLFSINTKQCNSSGSWRLFWDVAQVYVIRTKFKPASLYKLRGKWWRLNIHSDAAEEATLYFSVRDSSTWPTSTTLRYRTTLYMWQ